ncbi:putative xenobiotic-transporting ATPase [Rosa chinensis]|uniref:Putative xenobiotic-transporting ATPase n=1 Tax=Rosa chinensis TaxID=74649 RepID=A0A2P6SPK1_ROSCH|nr:putative xenobiotic-transporting ATPase [Rosa chinensis]
MLVIRMLAHCDCSSLAAVVGGLETSKSLFSQLLNSLFCAAISFYDSTSLGRILSRVSSDLNITDLDIPFSIVFACVATMNAYCNLGVLTVVTWQVLFVSIPMVCVAIQLDEFGTTNVILDLYGFCYRPPAPAGTLLANRIKYNY